MAIQRARNEETVMQSLAALRELEVARKQVAAEQVARRAAEAEAELARRSDLLARQQQQQELERVESEFRKRTAEINAAAAARIATALASEQALAAEQVSLHNWLQAEEKTLKHTAARRVRPRWMMLATAVLGCGIAGTMIVAAGAISRSEQDLARIDVLNAATAAAEQRVGQAVDAIFNLGASMRGIESKLDKTEQLITGAQERIAQGLAADRKRREQAAAAAAAKAEADRKAREWKAGRNLTVTADCLNKALCK